MAGQCLLLHGKNFSGAYWASTIEALVAEGASCAIAPDQIGFGKSSKPRHFQFSFHELATHTQALLADLGVSSAAVVGHSMGGMLAVRYALMFPDHTDALILVNPIGLEDWKIVVPYRPIDTVYQGELSSTPERVKEYMRKAYFDGAWQAAYDPLAVRDPGRLDFGARSGADGLGVGVDFRHGLHAAGGLRVPADSHCDVAGDRHP